MTNTIASVVLQLPNVIDKVNKESAISSSLNVSSGDVKMGLEKSNEVQIRKWSFGGLGNYDGTGIPANTGAVASWETQKLLVKRATTLPLELIEGIEGQAELATMIAEFQRTMVVPERDAVVFSKAYANADASTTATPATLDKNSVKDAIDSASETLNQKEAPKEREAYVSPQIFTALINAPFFTYNVDAQSMGNRDSRVGNYNGMKVIEVPSSRFNTGVTLSATNGFSLTGTDINFLIICKGAVQVIDKITKGEVVPSAVNGSSFEDIYKYLAYYDAITWDNQAVNIYAHAKAE